jgi:hypothetical protein
MADNASLQSQYFAQVEADLERNTKEKERIAADMASLQKQLTALEEDHALLVGVHQALVSALPSPEPDIEGAGAPADLPTAVVPRTRKPEAAAHRSNPSASKKTEAAKGGAGSAVGDVATAPTLVALVAAELAGKSEPRSAAEVGMSLTQACPGRKIQTTVVRNTLEALVAKGQALRFKQGRSVYYLAPETTPPAVAATVSAAATD